MVDIDKSLKDASHALMAAATPNSTGRGAKKTVAIERRMEDFLGAMSEAHHADWSAPATIRRPSWKDGTV